MRTILRGKIIALTALVGVMLVSAAFADSRPPPLPPDAGTKSSPDTANHGGRTGLRGLKPLKAAVKGTAIGAGVSATALVVRSAYVGATEHRELMYGEAYCTAEFGSPLVFKSIRIIGGLISGRLIPIKDVIICPEDKLNAQYSPGLYAKVHHLGKKSVLKKKFKKKIKHFRGRKFTS